MMLGCVFCDVEAELVIVPESSPTASVAGICRACWRRLEELLQELGSPEKWDTWRISAAVAEVLRRDIERMYQARADALGAAEQILSAPA